MLFVQLNGQQGRPVEDSTEIGVVQRVACEIGPSVDGVRVPRSLPQAMGAFVTAGAQGACAGSGQQMEQHVPTTMHGFGAAMAPEAAPTTPTTPAPGTGAPKFALIQTIRAPTPTMFAPTVAPGLPGAPTNPDAVTYPPGTITAFSSKPTTRWRVAIPAGSSLLPTGGLGIFGAATPAFTEVPSVQAPPASATQTTESDLEAKTGQLPFYKKPLFWGIVAGSVVVIGGGSWLLLRRRKSAAAPAGKQVTRAR